MVKISVITVFNDFVNFKDLMLYNFNNINYPKELIEWIIVDDSKKYNGDLFPMEEIFMGSNEKSYKHKYYLAYIKDSKNLDLNSVKIITSTGSPLAEESFRYVYDN